ncbi:MAG TPA: DUF3014 domain-containing protein [Thermoanaerobaculia bacterium]|nr:DUF3014 domain-containing protein [Thermoanaerobaculia bacterium]
MSEVDHIRLRDEDGNTDTGPGLVHVPEGPSRDEEDRSRLVWVVAIVIALALAVAAAIWWSRRGEEAAVEEPPPVFESTTPEVEPPPAEPAIELPPLDQSDSLVRELVARLSSHPQLARWLVNDELVRRTARVVGNVAWDEDPSTHLPFLKPSGPFRVRQEGGATTADPRSFERYDLAVDVFTSIDAAGAAALYRNLRPLLAQAYGELGYPGNWDEALRAAMRVVLATPAIPEDAPLAPDVLTYRYLDASLEELPAAQKLMLRAGPRNAERMKAKVRELASAAGVAP